MVNLKVEIARIEIGSSIVTISENNCFILIVHVWDSVEV